VGIGISGNEGQQAVNSSDFAIAQFRFLKRLLLVHGRWNYRRHSKTVLYSFYKNLVLVMTLFFFLFYCGFSGTAVYEDNILAGYNFFLGLPIFTLGLFDRDVTADFAMANPWMYVSGRKNLDLNSLQVRDGGGVNFLRDRTHSLTS
jgi:magnesium-transporting ATPase (P-type)